MQDSVTISPNDNSFIAGGQKFIIHSSVNIERYRRLDELQLRARFGQNYAQLHQDLTKFVNHVNKGQQFQANVLIHNIMQGTNRAISGQHDPMLLICTLFCCTENEDRTQWDEETANEKIKVWSEAGIDVNDFFLLALQFCRRFQQDLAADFLSTSETEQGLETEHLTAEDY